MKYINAAACVVEVQLVLHEVGRLVELLVEAHDPS